MYFPTRLERLFERETHLARSRHLVTVGFFWIVFGVVYAIFSPASSASPRGVHQIVRLGIVTPMVAAVTIAIWWGVRPFIRELLMMVANIAAPASIILLLTLAQDGDMTATRGGLTIVLLFITVVVRLRFWYATVACFSLVGVQVSAPVLFNTPVPGNVPLVVATIAATLIANYTLEREYRLNYLQRVLGRIQGANLAAMVDQLHDLSLRDALTGLPNRRALDSQLDELCADREPFSVILVDVDSFKAFNDLYGHQVGDDCLRRLAAMLRASLRRTTDRVTRMGGEEFAVVLPLTKLADAYTMAERMRKSILDLRIPHTGSATGDVVSISAGVSEARIPTTPGEVLTRADKALYQAKSEGRNRVVLSRDQIVPRDAHHQ
jgi:diguanylate cyclase (GGDEF)-like protein